jgi:hypothetical protein
VTATVRTAALAAVIVVCAALTTACGGHTGAADGGGQPASATVTPGPSATGPGIAELTRIVDAAQSAAAAADSDAAKD